MAAPTAMVASQRPMTAPSVGPPPLNGVHSPPAPLKCPAVQRAPSGRNGEASTSCSWPLSKPKPSCSSQALHAFLPGSAEHRRAVGECKGVASQRASRHPRPHQSPSPRISLCRCLPAPFQPCPKHRAAPRAPLGMRCPSRPGTPRRGWSIHHQRGGEREPARTATHAFARLACGGRSGRERPSTQGQRPAADLAYSVSRRVLRGWQGWGDRGDRCGRQGWQAARLLSS